MEKASEVLDPERSREARQEMKKGQFDLNDLAKQLGQMQKMAALVVS